MGKRPSTTASAFRKPLSLKQPRLLAKAGKGVVGSGKENAIINYIPDSPVAKGEKKTIESSQQAESSERAALRKRVEDAVAQHLVARQKEEQSGAVGIIPLTISPEGTPSESSPISFPGSLPQKIVRKDHGGVKFLMSVCLVLLVVVWSAVRVTTAWRAVSDHLPPLPVPALAEGAIPAQIAAVQVTEPVNTSTLLPTLQSSCDENYCFLLQNGADYRYVPQPTGAVRQTSTERTDDQSGDVNSLQVEVKYAGRRSFQVLNQLRVAVAKVSGVVRPVRQLLQTVRRAAGRWIGTAARALGLKIK